MYQRNKHHILLFNFQCLIQHIYHLCLGANQNYYNVFWRFQTNDIIFQNYIIFYCQIGGSVPNFQHLSVSMPLGPGYITDASVLFTLTILLYVGIKKIKTTSILHLDKILVVPLVCIYKNTCLFFHTLS